MSLHYFNYMLHGEKNTSDAISGTGPQAPLMCSLIGRNMVTLNRIYMILAVDSSNQAANALKKISA